MAEPQQDKARASEIGTRMTSTTTDRPQDMRPHAVRPAHKGASASRVDAAIDRARRHSRRVRALKFLLPAAALLAAIGFAGVSWLATSADFAFDIGATAIEDGRLVMSDPKLDGFTGDDRPYSMSAVRAVQDLGNTSRIELEGIDARLPFDETNWITVAARSGIIDRDANTLDLDDEVQVTTDTGIVAILQSAKVDIKAGSLDSDEYVDITMSGARIEADSLQVRERGAVMIFENRVRVEIEPGRFQTASTGVGGTDEN